VICLYLLLTAITTMLFDHPLVNQNGGPHTKSVVPCSYKACLESKGGCGFFSPSSANAMLVDELYLADIREDAATLYSLLTKITGKDGRRCVVPPSPPLRGNARG
jgi:hypothetical protein